MSREKILRSIRAATSRKGSSTLPEDDPAFPEYSDLWEKFSKEARQVGTEVLRADSEGDLQSALSQILSRSGATTILWQGTECLKRHGLPYRLEDEAGGSASFLVSSHPDGEVSFPLTLEKRSREQIAAGEVRLSVGGAEAGFAETGTVVESSAQVGRVLAILPPYRLLFVREEDLQMSLAGYFEGSRERSPASARLFTTGPSRTADIEKILIMGVHGPRELFVVVTSRKLS